MGPGLRVRARLSFVPGLGLGPGLRIAVRTRFKPWLKVVARVGAKGRG